MFEECILFLLPINFLIAAFFAFSPIQCPIKDYSYNLFPYILVDTIQEKYFCIILFLYVFYSEFRTFTIRLSYYDLKELM